MSRILLEKNNNTKRKSLIFQSYALFFGLIIVAFFSVWLFLKADNTKNNNSNWIAPAWTDSLKSPFPKHNYIEWSGTQDVVVEGEHLYNNYCATCHGKYGFGDGAPGITFEIPPANFHDSTIGSQKDGALFWKLTEGKGQMPGFKETLTEKQRWELVYYIRNLESLKGNEFKNPELKNMVPVSNFRINKSITSHYFAIPDKITNVVKSELQYFMVDTVIKELKLPWSMILFPDQRTILISERPGKLLLYRNGEFIGNVEGEVPTGLRDIKLSPLFRKDSSLFISYYIEPDKLRKKGGYSVLMRAVLKGNSIKDNKILYKAGPFKEDGFWFGSKITFDHSWHLFFTVGIRGNRKNAQDLSNQSGKTMRFNTDGSIPPDNPFLNKPGALPEIFSYGHRMHEGIVYDEVSNQVYSSEFGELGGDEINIIKPGANYGWPEVTFSLEYNGKKISDDTVRADVETPIHHMVIAPSDLSFLEGNKYQGWNHNRNLFVGALRKTGPFLYRMEMKNKVLVGEEELLEGIGRVRDVKVGADGLLYLMTEDTGLVVRLIPVEKEA